MPNLYAAADLVVCRSGATSVAEIAAVGIPAVLVPLPGAPGDHQTANARALVDADAAVLIPDSQCDAARLATEVDSLLAERELLAHMAANAATVARLDADERVARLAEEHAKRARTK